MVWEAQILSELGDWAARVALALLVYDRTHSRAWTAAVTAVGMLPWLGMGQALAALGDRYARRAVMVACDLVRAVLYLAMVWTQPTGLLLLFAFIAAAAAPPFEAARAAIIPDAVSEEAYGDALTVSSLTYQVGLVLGYISGGGLVAALGSRNALIVNAITFLGSAVLVTRVRAGRHPAATDGVGASLRRAAQVLRRDPFLRRGLAIASVGASCAMVGEALVAVYVREHLHGGGGQVGALSAMIPVGTIVTSLLVPRKGDHAMLLRASALIVLIGGSLAVPLFLIEPGPVVSALGFVALGIAFAMTIPSYSVIGSRLPADVRATAFGLLQGVLLGGQALTSIAGGFLANVVGAPVATGLALIPAIGFALYAIAVPPREAVPPRGSVEEEGVGAP